MAKWNTVDGWSTREEAIDHTLRLRKAHRSYRFRIYHSSRKYGGGNWHVQGQEKSHDGTVYPR